MIARRMQVLMLGCLASLGLALSVTAGMAAGSTHGNKPLIKAFSYKPIGNPNTAVNPQATFKLTIHVYAHAPSVAIYISGNHGNIDTSVLFPKSYGAGVHHLSIKADALPAGKFKVLLVVNLPGGKLLRGSNPATLIVNAAGAGKVPKL